VVENNQEELLVTEPSRKGNLENDYFLALYDNLFNTILIEVFIYHYE